VPINNLLSRKDEPNEDIYDLYWESKNYLTEIDKLGNEVLRLTQKRGRRKIITPTTEQQEQLDKIKTEIADLQKVVLNVVLSTSKRAEAQEAPSPPTEYTQQPPQSALLERAVNAIRAMLQIMPAQALLQNALGGLESATSLIMVSRAVDILDGLVASGVSLSEEAEACRKELRAQIGLSPVAPVSLEQALAEEGFSPATPREQAIIKAIDDGLLTGIGGRGEKYEAMICIIAEAIARQQELR
jgi:DNA-binding MarR family transcriptional regulator